MRILPRPILFACLLPAIVSAASGCTMPGRVGWSQVGWTNVGLSHVGWLKAVRDRQAKPQIEQTHIVYELRGPHGALVWTSLEPFAVAGGSDDDFALTSTTRWKGAVLKINYPHPDGLADTARAELRLSRSSADDFRDDLSLAEKTMERVRRTIAPLTFWRTEDELIAPSSDEPEAAHDELWVLDFPKHDLDQMVGDLAAGGLFDQQVRPDCGARIVADVNDKQTAKMWTPEPRLDDLILRTYREGRLEGYVEAAAKGDQAAE